MRQKKLVYYGKKCLIFLISVFILSVAVFYVARLAPGDPLISYYGAVSYTHLKLPTILRV